MIHVLLHGFHGTVWEVGSGLEDLCSLQHAAPDGFAFPQQMRCSGYGGAVDVFADPLPTPRPLQGTLCIQRVSISIGF